MREKYTFTFSDGKLVTSKGIYETRIHVVLKLIAYLYLGSDIKIEQRYEKSFKYKPDLFRVNSDGLLTWVECGKVSEKKIHYLIRHLPQAVIHIFKKDRNDAQYYINSISSEMVKIYHFEKNFIKNISVNLKKRNSVEFLRTGSSVKVVLNGAVFISDVFRILSSKS